MAYGKGMHGECERRKQSRIGIIIRLIKNSRISFSVISPTCIKELAAGESACVEEPLHQSFSHSPGWEGVSTSGGIVADVIKAATIIVLVALTRVQGVKPLSDKMH